MFHFLISLFLFIELIVLSLSQEPIATVGKGVPTVTANAAVDFLELLRQRFDRGNAVQQCPCVIPPGSDKCVAYDPRYAAASVEEAIVAFIDLTVDEFNSNPLSKFDYNCTSTTCLQCAALIFYRLMEIGFIPPNYPSRFSFPLPMLRDMHPNQCRRFWLTRRRTLRAPPTVTPEYVRQMIDQGQRYIEDYSRFPSTQFSQQVSQTLSQSHGSQYQVVLDSTQNQVFTRYVYETIGEVPAPQLPVPPQLPPPPQIPFPLSPVQNPPVQIPAPQNPVTPDPIAALINAKILFLQHLFAGLGKKRKKRNTANVNDDKNIIGERFVISCVDKGDAESDETDFMNLCTACWTWRKLPDDYFPPILNELVCQENDFCLSGWGSCTQRYRQVDVLRKIKGKWNPTTVVSGACCDCKIRAGTEVHQLVIGNTRRDRSETEGILAFALRETRDRPIITTTSIPLEDVNIA